MAHINVLILSQGSSVTDIASLTHNSFFHLQYDLIRCCHPRVLHTVKLFSFAPASSSLNDSERIANDLMKPFSLSLPLRDFLIHSYECGLSQLNAPTKFTVERLGGEKTINKFFNRASLNISLYSSLSAMIKLQMNSLHSAEYRSLPLFLMNTKWIF